MCVLCEGAKCVFCVREPSVWGSQVCVLCKGAKCVRLPRVWEAKCVWEPSVWGTQMGGASK